MKLRSVIVGSLLLGAASAGLWSVTPGGDPASPPEKTAPADAPESSPAPADTAPKTPAPSSAPWSFEHFRLLLQRNIFDPARRPAPSAERKKRPPKPRSERLTLTGAICYGGRAFAFFDGSQSDWHGVFSPGDQVAGWTVARVDSRGVRLEREAETRELRVGESLVRRGEEPWRVTQVALAGQEPPATEKEPAAPEEAKSSAPAGEVVQKDRPAPGAGEPRSAPGHGRSGLSEIMKRMMERRKREESQ